MSREGYLLEKLSNLHSKYKTPHRAIIFQGLWSLLLVFSGTFNQLLSYVVFVILIFSSFAGYISLSILVKSQIKNYKKIITCGIYLVICLVISFNTILYQTIESMIGLIIMLIALIFYFIEMKINKKNIIY